MQDYSRVSDLAKGLEADALRKMDEYDRRKKETAASEVSIYDSMFRSALLASLLYADYVMHMTA